VCAPTRYLAAHLHDRRAVGVARPAPGRADRLAPEWALEEDGGLEDARGALEQEQPMKPDPGLANPNVARRSWLKIAAGTAAAGLLPRQVGCQPRAAARSATGESIVASDSAAIARTTHGKVRGFVHKGMLVFRGIPYGAPTSGARRFMAPAKPAPWTGVRSALAWGFASPQIPPEHWDKDEVAFVYEWNPGAQGEDCLRLNVWTPGLDNQKRAVMVWLHGGGFATGSGNEMNVYDGENLARHDVVVVSLNHRVGAVGFLDLSSIGGEEFAASGNMGLLDIVAALEWVRDNVASFGGDPANVTIFGQSGGGGKVTALMAMPRARGLFHKAIVESGSMRRMLTPDFSAKLAEAVLKEAGVGKARLEALQDTPFDRLVTAAEIAARKVYPAGDYSRPIDFGRYCELNAWAPTVDGTILPEHPFWTSAPAASAGVPLIVGSTLTEFGIGFGYPGFEGTTLRELRRRILKGHGREHGRRILEAFRRGHPDASPAKLSAIWFSSGARHAAVQQAALKAAQGGAPAYLYWFAWDSPILDGRLHSFHCCDMPFVFDNTDRCDHMTGGGPGARALASRISSAWVQFARTGNPNHGGLPSWPAFDVGPRSTMIFDDTCAVRSDPDGEELKALDASMKWT
jgi:para-nitrobenzyl esterase